MRQKSEAGFTFVEVLIASILLAGIIGVTIQTFSTGMLAYDTLSIIGNAEGILLVRLDNIINELLECNPQYVWVKSFKDPYFATPQKLLVFLSARNSFGTFVISNGHPVFQSVVAYCPYTYIDNNGQVKKVLKRYEEFNVPSGYLQASFTFTYTLTADRLVLPYGITFQRNLGQTILTELNDFSITGTYPLRISVQILAKTPKSDVPITLTSELSGRNKN